MQSIRRRYQEPGGGAKQRRKQHGQERGLGCMRRWGPTGRFQYGILPEVEAVFTALHAQSEPVPGYKLEWHQDGAGSCVVGSSPGVIAMEGPLRRKTLLKEGKKPTLSSWTRYWVTLSGSTLVYFGAKSLRGNERKNYKSTPSKKVSVVSWMVVLPDDPEHPNIFQLNNPDKGNVYKFQTGSRFHAILWHKHLDDACKSSRPQAPANLMSFE